MTRLNICIDLDGTVTEPDYWLARANAYFDKNVLPHQLTTYDIEKILGIERKAYDRFYSVYGEMIHRESAIRIGASQVINKLYDAYHNIHFVTARDPRMEKVSVEWLERNYIPMDSISLLGRTDKVGKAMELRSDIFIEDSYDNTLQLAQAGFDVLLVDCPYNRGCLPTNVTRVSNWYQIARFIDKRMHSAGDLARAL